ncbi:MAG: SsrA-binding protein SmpB [Candidatus Saccharimonadales bacterium]
MKVIAKNRRTRFDYDIDETLISGVVLAGSEVKSIKNGQVSLQGSYVIIKNAEAFLVGAHVSAYKQALEAPEETRDRKLLLHKKEIDFLVGKKQSGYSIVPLAIGLERGLIKLEIGVGRGLKKYDKREAIKKREMKREAKRTR